MNANDQMDCGGPPPVNLAPIPSSKLLCDNDTNRRERNEALVCREVNVSAKTKGVSRAIFIILPSRGQLKGNCHEE